MASGNSDPRVYQALALPEHRRSKGADEAPAEGATKDEDADGDTRRPFAGLADLLAGKPKG